MYAGNSFPRGRRPQGLKRCLSALVLIVAACRTPAGDPVEPPQMSLAPPSLAPSVSGLPAPDGASASPVPLQAPQASRWLPGDELFLAAPPGERRLLLLANPSDQSGQFDVAVDPVGVQTTPAPLPSPGRSGGSRRAAPFGFGVAFDASLRSDGSLPGRRLFVAPTAAAAAWETFWINDGSATLAGDRPCDTRLMLQTENALFYVDEAAEATLDKAALGRLAEAFERRIRPPLTRVFGQEDRPGADGQPRLFIVLSPWVGQADGREGMMGYFWPRDPLAPSAEAADLTRHANQKEVIFLAARILEQPDVTALGTLAHEYQHLLTFCAKTRLDGTPRPEALWLDEGLSMLAMDLAGFGRVGQDPFVLDEVAAYMQNPAAYSLTDWAGNPEGRSYGLSYLFVRYLTGRFGLGIVAELQQTTRTGIAALDEVLARRGTSTATVYVDWLKAGAQALVSGEPGLGPVPLSLTEPTLYPVRPWGAVYLEAQAWPSEGRRATFSGTRTPLLYWRGIPGDPLGELGP
ncbi:MAG: hypothetical protein VKP62_10330 [Candidatus Sericytochromatia bacterium]|nr:hypothetical protein [Candidatus Sericytochromatia bacterium]